MMIYGNPRVGHLVNHFRYNYHMSINNIAKILGVSTRTVYRKIAFSRLVKKKFDNRHHPLKYEVKIVNRDNIVINLKTLTFRAQLYILGYLETFFQVSGDKPP